MDNILLRSPQYITQTNTTSGIASAELEITINGTLRYTLVKPASSSVAVLFEYAELARDYLRRSKSRNEYNRISSYF